MNQNILTEITCGVLSAGYLDVEFLVNTIEKYKLEVDEILDNIETNLGKEYMTNINYIIYQALTMVAYQFIESNKELFEEYSDEFQVYTNYMDSHIWFLDEEVQREFEKF